MRQFLVIATGLALGVVPGAAEKPPAPAVSFVDMSGAPGDGDLALSQALTSWLRRYGVKVVDGKSSPGACVVRGVTELGPIAGKAQSIAIRWIVLTPAGDPLSKHIVQTNTVKPGALESWGDAADMAAAPAAELLAQIMRGEPGFPCKAGTPKKEARR